MPGTRRHGRVYRRDSKRDWTGLHRPPCLRLYNDLVQHFIVGFHGATTEPSEDIKKLLRKPYYVGAVILMKRNVDGKRYCMGDSGCN